MGIMELFMFYIHLFIGLSISSIHSFICPTSVDAATQQSTGRFTPNQDYCDGVSPQMCIIIVICLQGPIRGYSWAKSEGSAPCRCCNSATTWLICSKPNLVFISFALLDLVKHSSCKLYLDPVSCCTQFFIHRAGKRGWSTCTIYIYIIILREATSLVTRSVRGQWKESVHSKLQWNLSITTT